MKNILLLFACFFLIMCKKDDPDPAPEIASIVGKWRYQGYEKVVNGEKIWVNETSTNSITIRFDGVMLDSDGFSWCCAPSAYNVNGTYYPIKPQRDIPQNPSCATVDCIACTVLQIDQVEDELIITTCINGGRSKYVRD